jgi:hypothetical protein
MRLNLLLALVLALTVIPSPTFGATAKAGIRFPLAEKNAMQVAINGRLMTVEGRIWSATGGLGGGEHIHFDARIKNASQTTAFYSILIAFFDSQWNLIAADGFTQIFGQSSGKIDSHNANLYLPKDGLRNVAVYQITFYDDSASIGKQ